MSMSKSSRKGASKYPLYFLHIGMVIVLAVFLISSNCTLTYHLPSTKLPLMVASCLSRIGRLFRWKAVNPQRSLCFRA